MEEQRKQRPQNAVDDDERRIPSGHCHHHHSERKLREERAAKLRVERELQRAKDRRALDAFRKSYAARASRAFQEARKVGREEAPPPLGLGNFISHVPSKHFLSPHIAEHNFLFPCSEKTPLAGKMKRNLEGPSKVRFQDYVISPSPVMPGAGGRSSAGNTETFWANF